MFSTAARLVTSMLFTATAIPAAAAPLAADRDRMALFTLVLLYPVMEMLPLRLLASSFTAFSRASLSTSTWLELSLLVRAIMPLMAEPSAFPADSMTPVWNTSELLARAISPAVRLAPLATWTRVSLSKSW